MRNTILINIKLLLFIFVISINTSIYAKPYKPSTGELLFIKIINKIAVKRGGWKFINEDGWSIKKNEKSDFSIIQSDNFSKSTLLLSLAALNGWLEAMQLLIDKKCDINMKDSEGDSSLHKAAYMERVEPVRVLLEHGANINQKNKDGMTPLHLTVFSLNVETAELLITKGAEVNMRNNLGETPLFILRNYIIRDGDPKIEMDRLLSSKGGVANSKRGNDSVQNKNNDNNISKAHKLIENGIKKHKAGLYNDAIGEFRKALRKTVGKEKISSEAYYHTAESEAALKDFKKAITDVSMAIYLNNGDCRFYKLRENLLRKTGDIKEADDDLKKIKELGCGSSVNPQSTLTSTPILKLDTGGHMAIIKKIIPMKDGRRIISASDDKTIRIWDTQTGQERAKILGQIGSGLEGQIFAIALTPDERYLAVAGYMETGYGKNFHYIRIFNLNSGELINILKSHENIVNDLAISIDGKYLISASADKTVKVWDITDNFTLIHTFTGHTSYVLAVRIFRSGGYYKIVSTGFDNKIILWSLNDKKMIKSITHNKKLKYLAVCDAYIAVSGIPDSKIYIFDHSLTQKEEIESETIIAGLSFSPDGRLLLTGTSERPRVCNIYDRSVGFKKISSFFRHDNTTTAITFLNNHTAVTGGGNNADIYLWDAFTGNVKMQITGHGKRVWSVGIRGSDIAFGNTFSYEDQYSRGKLEKSINLENFTVSLITQSVGFKRINTTYQGYSLTHSAGGEIELENAVLLIKKDGTETALISRDAADGSRHNTYGFTEDGSVLSGGTHGFLTVYNRQGEKKASFIGHTGEIWNISIDGDILASGSSDQTIKLWNLKDLKDGKKEIFPIVSIFISKDNEWVIWNEDGFYNASAKGDRFVGWHVNHGPDKSADYYTARQFRKYLYRPDVIKKTIELGSSAKAMEVLSKNEPGLKNITVAELIKRAPVDVKIDSVKVAKNNRTEVAVRLGKNTTTVPERITIYINGMQVLTEKERPLTGSKPGDIIKYMINLPENKNHIKVTVENQWAENSAEISVDNLSGSTGRSTRDTTLYVVAIGISIYPKLSEDQQLQSPSLDAKSIAGRFKKLEGKHYKKVDVLTLTDDSKKVITSAMVENALIEQTRKAGPLDTTIVFLDGHGVTDTQGSYHFVTADTKLKNAWGEQSIIEEGTSLDWKRLHRILDNTMGRRLVIVDTCQAGEVFSENRTDITRLVKDVHDINAIIYSGTSRQDSGIDTPKGGVFTLSIVSGFDGKATYEGDILPFARLKDYVDREVPRMNSEIMSSIYKRAVKSGMYLKNTVKVNIDGVQKPMAVIPYGMEGFIIYGK